MAEGLEVVGLRRSFGGVVAVDVERFEVAPAQIVGLIGPNGAGKSTFFDVLTGFVAPDAGRWSLDGRDLTHDPPHRIAGAGVVRTFQVARPLASLTTLDNLVVAAAPHTGERLAVAVAHRRWRRREAEVRARAVEVLEWCGLADQALEPAGQLSGGQRKLLELGRALVAEARVLLLDEPTAGVAPAMVEVVVSRLVELRRRGVAVVVVEHDLDLVASVSDELVCLHRGRVVARGRPEEVTADPVVVDAYLGGTEGAW